MDKRAQGHWTFEDFRQRVTRKEAQEILINEPTVIFKGHTRDLAVKHIGAGVYEIYKKPIPKEQPK